MSAKQKLEEAKFFLEELHGLQSLPQDSDKQRKSKYYRRAFLSAAVSVLDHLLEDYNAKFSLNIPLSTKLYPKTFEEAARKANNQLALSFIQWWEKEKKALKKDPVGGLLIGKRNINTHRLQTKPDLAKINAGDGSLPTSGSLEARLFRDSELLETRKSAEQPPPSREEREATFDWFFSEYPDEPVLTVCEKFLARVTSFVSEAERRFP